jgi:acetone carboxylase gamma subunit
MDRKPRDAMHFWVDDEWMFYREHYCPKCWSLVRVDAMSRKDENYSFF